MIGWLRDKLGSHLSLPLSPHNWRPQGRLSRCPNDTTSQAARELAPYGPWALGVLGSWTWEASGLVPFRWVGRGVAVQKPAEVSAGTHEFIHLFTKHSLSPCSMPSARDTERNPWELWGQGGGPALATLPAPLPRLLTW